MIGGLFLGRGSGIVGSLGFHVELQPHTLKIDLTMMTSSHYCRSNNCKKFKLCIIFL